ncbi:MAG: type II toxin-antitoxin system VapB family antitoxin [Verrucomicrobiae bacterium]|nr:type II toxin-antitoxin system VapB family antitoxin [Verrucomicrobiae bacterium]
MSERCIAFSERDSSVCGPSARSENALHLKPELHSARSPNAILAPRALIAFGERDPPEWQTGRRRIGCEVVPDADILSFILHIAPLYNRPDDRAGIQSHADDAAVSPRNKAFRPVDLESFGCYCGIMKTTVDIPEKELKDAMRLTGAKTKREAIVTALTDFNQRKRMAALTRHFGKSNTFMTHAELMKMRQMD